jgi:outer membrane immunogenic protein
MGQRKTMKKAALASVSVFAILAAGQANSADIYRAPQSAGGYKDDPVYVAPWAGFYAGVNGGGAWSEFSDQLANFNNINKFNGLSPSGGFGGGQIGYNWQGVWHPQLVLGIEADIQGAGISDKATWNPFGNVIAVSESRLDWFGTVRSRLGYAFGSALVYGTGGFAFGGIHNTQADNRPVVFAIDKTATGFTAGGGVEYTLTPAWSVKAEYQFIDLGKNDPFSPSPGQGLFTNFKTKLEDDAFNTFRVGVNYHFGGSYAPLK